MTNEDGNIEKCSQATIQSLQNGRVTAAKVIMKSILEHPNIGSYCKKLEKLHILLIRLANSDVKHRKKEANKSAFTLPDSNKLGKMVDMQDVAIPTVPMAVNANGIYPVDKLIGIHSLDENFVLVGGANAPKKLTCKGTDGKTRSMLLKGKDDSRQDAIMQQVFSAMNLFLEQDDQARKRKLHIKTYKVVPLSRKSGLLEWCDNTSAIGVYLLGK